MNLIELIVAVLITSLSLSSSVYLQHRSFQAARSIRSLSKSATQLDRYWIASFRWLSKHHASCEVDHNHLASRMNQVLPLPSDLHRSIAPDDVPLSLWLHLSDDTTGLQRSLLFSSAGFGRCWPISVNHEGDVLS